MSKPHHGFPSGYFKIRSRLTGKCLDIKGSNTQKATVLITENCHSGYNQHWYIDRIGRIISRLNGMAVDIKGTNKENGAIVYTWPPHGAANQQWYVDSVGRIISRLSEKSLSFDENNKGSAPVYVWESYNGPSQKWYFEKIADSDQTVNIVKSYGGESNDLKISSEMIQPSAELTYQFWMKLDKFDGGIMKNILCKSQSAKDTKATAPGLWINSNALKFDLRIKTIKKDNDGINIVYDIPLRKWINVAFQIKGNVVEFYVDGIRKSTGKMDGEFSPNNNDLWIGHNNKFIHLKDVEYSNYALTIEQIKKNMRSTDPRLIDKPSTPMPMEEDIPSTGVTITKFVSNGSHKDCAPYRARLGTGRAWCAITKTTDSYLEAVLDKSYHIKKIMTQGRADSNQWVQTYAIKYYDNNKWVNASPSVFKGNNDRNSIKTNTVDFTSQKIRFYPLTWKEWPSVRLGFDGIPSSQSKCLGYKEQSIKGSTDMIRKSNLDAYNRECRMISYFKYLQGLEQEKHKYEKLYELLNTIKQKNTTSLQEADELKKKLHKIKSILKRTTLDLELAKSKKCPPTRACLPVITPTVAPKKSTINDYDIRTHNEFHKYVLATSVKPCEAGTPVAQQSTAPIVKQLSQCQAQFTNNDVGMQGGGVYGRLCQLTSQRDIIAQPTQLLSQSAFYDGPYSISKHKDFNNLMENYMLKSKCKQKKRCKPKSKSKSKPKFAPIETHPDFKNYVSIRKVQQLSKKMLDDAVNVGKFPINCALDITQHPRYKELMNKYALSSPDGYQPCKSLTDYPIEQHPDAKNYVKKTDVNKIQNKTMELADSIRQAKLVINQQQQVINKLKNAPIEQHPDAKNYIKKTVVKKIQDETMELADSTRQARQVINKQQQVINKLKNAPIEQHSQYPSLMTKFNDINNYPDAGKYMLKTQIQCSNSFRT
jgi:hypothetical protein